MRLLGALAACLLAALIVGCEDEQSPPAANPTPRGGTARVEFAASPDPPVAGSGIVVDVLGSNGVRFGPSQTDQPFDSIVFEFKAGSTEGWVEDVDRADVVSCGPGDVVPLQGQAVLKVHFEGAGQHEDFVPTGAPRELKGSGAILEAKLICDFEAVLEWAIGTSGVQNFTVETEDDPKRVVINVMR